MKEKILDLLVGIFLLFCIISSCKAVYFLIKNGQIGGVLLIIFFFIIAVLSED